MRSTEILTISFISLFSLFLFSFPISGLIVDGQKYDHTTANFGPKPGEYNITSTLILASPRMFCKGSKMPEAKRKIILIGRSPRNNPCLFSEKVYTAQISPTNAAAVIIGDNIDEPLFPMEGSIYQKAINIPSVLVNKTTYSILVSILEKNSFSNNIHNATLNLIGEVHQNPTYIHIFLLLMLVAVILGLYASKKLLLFCLNRRQRNERLARISSISYSRSKHFSRDFDEMKAILIKTPSDQKIHNDSCAICLNDFNPNEQIKILPCNHGFHAICLDPWLKCSDLCPICKSSIMKDYQGCAETR